MSIFNWANPEDGEFKRQVSSFREYVVNDADSKFKPETGRYVLYVSLACPWAHRALLVRALKGLEDVIPVNIVDWHLENEGWKFTAENPDRHNNARFLKEIYFKAAADYSGRFTVPFLYDLKLHTIVNKESSEIIRMLNSTFDEFAKRPNLTFYPAGIIEEIDTVNEFVYDMVNNGVYKAGFATTQEAYDKNVKLVFEGLDRCEMILKSNEWMAGKVFTEADIRLFTTIIRFDPVYHTHFKCNLKCISHDYPNILRWARKVYQIPKVAETVNMFHIKHHYFVSHIQINPQRTVPIWNGPDLSTPKMDLSACLPANLFLQ